MSIALTSGMGVGKGGGAHPEKTKHTVTPTASSRLHRVWHDLDCIPHYFPSAKADRRPRGKALMSLKSCSCPEQSLERPPKTAPGEQGRRPL